MIRKPLEAASIGWSSRCIPGLGHVNTLLSIHAPCFLLVGVAHIPWWGEVEISVDEKQSE